MQTQSEEITKVQGKIKFWSQELQDMSGRNRLLFYKDTKSSTAIIELPRFFDLFERLVVDGAGFFAPLPDPKEAKSIFEDGQEEIEPSNSVKPPKQQKKLKDNEIQTNHTVPVLNKVLYNLRYTPVPSRRSRGLLLSTLPLGC